MSQPEKQEQGERAIILPVEAKAMQAVDVQAARVAGVSDVQAVQALNPNRHTGTAGGDQNQSIEIVAMGADVRQQVLASRPKEPNQELPLTVQYLRERAGKADIWAKQFLEEIDKADRLPASQKEQRIAKVLKDAEAVYGQMGQPSKAQIESDQFTTVEMLAEASKKSPAAEAVSLFKQWVEKQPEGPQKEALRQEVRQQAAEVSPELKERLEQRKKLRQKPDDAELDEDGRDKEITAEVASKHTGRVEHNQSLENAPDGWLAAGQAIAKLPIEKQAAVIGTGLLAGHEQYRNDERERAIGQVIGTVQGAGQVAENLAVIAEFSADVVCGNTGRATERGQHFGEAVGKTLASGVGLFKTADQYLFNVGYTADYGKPFKDVADFGAALNDRWSQMPPREQERIKYKFITEMVADGVIAGGGAKAIGKAKEFTEVLDAVAEQAAENALKHGGEALEASKKAANTIAGAIDDLMSPEMALPGGGKMKFPRDFGRPADKPITHVLMSKPDEVGGSGRLVDKGVDAAGKALKFSKESGIELVSEVAGNPTDPIWPKGWGRRGFEGEDHMGRTGDLVRNYPVVDEPYGFVKGKFASFKTINLADKTYQDAKKLESAIENKGLCPLQNWHGRSTPWAGTRIYPHQVKERILHYGIPNGTITDEQQQAFERIGKKILDYNAANAGNKRFAPIRLKVEVIW